MHPLKNKLLHCVLFYSLLSFGKCACAFLHIGEEAKLYVDSNLQARYESNIFKNEVNAKDDFIFVFSPGLRLKFGSEHSPHKLFFTFREDFYVYTQHKRLNHQDANVRFNGELCFCRLSLVPHFSYSEKAQNTPDANVADQLIKSRHLRAGLGIEYELTCKFTLASGVHFYNKNYNTVVPSDPLVDLYQYTIPVNLYYQVTPKLQLGPSYAYKHYHLEKARDFNDHFFGLGVRGELACNLCIEGHVGGVRRVINRKTSTANFQSDLMLKWNPAPRLSTYAKGYRNYDASAFGPSILNTGAEIGSTYDLTCFLDLKTSLNFNRTDYRTFNKREDDSWQFNGSLEYKYDPFVILSSGYIFQKNDSNLAGNSFCNHIAFFRARLVF